VQSVPIVTNVLSSNPAHGKVYSIQHYVIKFVSDLRQVVGFLHKESWPPQYSWNIVESGVKELKTLVTIGTDCTGYIIMFYFYKSMSIFSKFILTIIMVYRKMLYFHWTPGQVYQAMYTAGVVDIYHMVKWVKLSPVCKFYLWVSQGTLVSSTNKTDRYDITEILLKVVLNTTTLTLNI
jgi:hypothetical protein